MKLVNYNEKYRRETVVMIMDFFNEHRDMLNSRKEFYVDEKEASDSLTYWCEQSEVFLVIQDTEIIGFVRIRYGGTKAAWLEDLFVKQAFRGQGLGTKTLKLVDERMNENKILSMFVDVIPRNPAAIRLYLKNGFDHLNMIQLRKNYDKELNKTEKIDVLGFEFIKY